LAERVELRGDEIETSGKVPEDEGEDRKPLILARGDRTEQRDDQEEKGKQREQRVVRDCRRGCQVVAVGELDQPAPGGLAGPTKLGPKPFHADIIRDSGLGIRDSIARISNRANPESRIPSPESRSTSGRNLTRSSRASIRRRTSCCRCCRWCCRNCSCCPSCRSRSCPPRR